MEASSEGGRAVSDFKGRHFGGEIVLWAVRWYCRYGISYRDLEQMMAERGVSVDHSTIYRWVQRYAPEIEERLRWHWRRPRSRSWRVDETYVKVRGKWSYNDSSSRNPTLTSLNGENITFDTRGLRPVSTPQRTLGP